MHLLNISSHQNFVGLLLYPSKNPGKALAALPPVAALIIRYLKTYINQTSTVVWYKLEGEVIYITVNGSSVGSCSGETITSSVLMENILRVNINMKWVN